MLGGRAHGGPTGQTLGMQPLAVHHVAINVTDLASTTHFYTEVLGGTVRADRPDVGVGGAWIDLGASQVHLLEAAVAPALGQHFAVGVADLDGAVGELRDRGLAVYGPVPIGAGRQAFVADPSGNTVELVESPAVP